MAQPTLSDVIESHIEGFRDQLYTAVPATIESVDNYSTDSTITVRPSINRNFSDGKEYELPLLYDVPVQFPSGGGATLTFPLQVGDDVLVVFSMRSLDEWFVSPEGTVSPQDKRWHNLSDGIAIPCIYREENSLTPSSEHVELKWDDTVIRITDDKNVQIVTDSSISITNSTDELITELINALRAIQNTTVTTVFGASPLNNAAAITAIVDKIETFKE